MTRRIRVLTLMALGGLIASSAHADSNRVVVSDVHGFEGWARIVRAGTQDTFDALKVQQITAQTICQASGYRAWKVGPKVFPNPRLKGNPKHVVRSHTWTPGTAEAAPVKNFGDVCRSSDRAAYIPVKVSGNCVRALPPFGFESTKGNWHSSSRKLAFALDCQGYPDSDREALVNFWSSARQDNVSLPFSKLNSMKTQGYEPAWVIAQVYKTNTPFRRELKWMYHSTTKLNAIAAHPDTIAQMKSKGWIDGSVGGPAKFVGYANKNPGSGNIALHSYYHPGRQDFATGARADIIEKLKSAGFQHVRVEGYVPPIKQ